MGSQAGAVSFEDTALSSRRVRGDVSSRVLQAALVRCSAAWPLTPSRSRVGGRPGGLGVRQDRQRLLLLVPRARGLPPGRGRAERVNEGEGGPLQTPPV